ncbi:hypothetical protein AZE42_11330 [Rhizopogon vesiculosus]|uniref:Uncharacterized protein n=1 Tax=Rhizopogon vesiculosus TaxID=180088 RepID=A0A1J8QF48_9AGAM|nr:hypothetical protein AZE42_11330 [Rhizopogon vesiculosus]
MLEYAEDISGTAALKMLIETALSEVDRLAEETEREEGGAGMAEARGRACVLSSCANTDAIIQQASAASMTSAQETSTIATGTGDTSSVNSSRKKR